MARFDPDPTSFDDPAPTPHQESAVDGYNISLDHITCVAEGLEHDLHINPADIITASLGFALNWASDRGNSLNAAASLKSIIDDLHKMRIKNN